MKIASFNQDITYSENKPATQVVLETAFTKEMRILLKKGQVMKEHKAPLPIIVHLLQGEVTFGVEGETYPLQAGSIITLEANVMHELAATEDSIVRLSLQKPDKSKRVEKVAEQ